MSKDIIKVNAPYVLEVGQGLLDQNPWRDIRPKLSKKHKISESIFDKGIMSAAQALIEQPRLPFFDNTPSTEARLYYGRIEKFLDQAGLDPTKLMGALKDMGNELIKHPNWLRYLYMCQKETFDGTYEEDGRWISQTIIEGRTTQPGPKTRLDAAESYPYWAYTHQIRVGLITPHEIDPTILTNAQVTQAIETGNENLIGSRTWNLLAAPLVPIPLKGRIIPFRKKLEGSLLD